MPSSAAARRRSNRLGGPPRAGNTKNSQMYPFRRRGRTTASSGRGTLDTKGGPVINTSAQVIHVSGKAIPGCTAPATASHPRRPGVLVRRRTIGPGITYGYIAGRNAQGARQGAQLMASRPSTCRTAAGSRPPRGAQLPALAGGRPARRTIAVGLQRYAGRRGPRADRARCGALAELLLVEAPRGCTWPGADSPTVRRDTTRGGRSELRRCLYHLEQLLLDLAATAGRAPRLRPDREEQGPCSRSRSRPYAGARARRRRAGRLPADVAGWERAPAARRSPMLLAADGGVAEALVDATATRLTAAGARVTGCSDRGDGAHTG